MYSDVRARRHSSRFCSAALVAAAGRPCAAARGTAASSDSMAAASSDSGAARVIAAVAAVRSAGMAISWCGGGHRRNSDLLGAAIIGDGPIRPGIEREGAWLPRVDDD